jgi:hypothetical protein
MRDSRKSSVNHALPPTPASGGSSAAQFTSLGPPWLSVIVRRRYAHLTNNTPMKTLIQVLAILITGLFVGCGQSGSSGSSGVAAGIEGTYFDPDDTDISLIIKNGHYQRGASDIHDEGTFTARKIDDATWELDIVHNGRLAGTKSTQVVRRQGDYVFIKDKDMPGETKFKRQ